MELYLPRAPVAAVAPVAPVAAASASAPSRPRGSPWPTSATLAPALLAFSTAVARGRTARQQGACRAEAKKSLGTRTTPDPTDLLLRVAKGEVGDHTPVWLMRQAGRYMREFRAYSERYPFRQRSETPSMATELSLQCWRQYGMDGVIVFSDILTPLPAMGIEFDVIRGRGPIVLGDLARTLKDRLQEGPRSIRAVLSSKDFHESHEFLHKTLKTLRSETEGKCSLLGFVGAPWTLAAYAVEAGSTKEAAVFKKWMYGKPEVVDEFLHRMTVTIGNYAIYQVESGAQCIQIFESWAHCLTPELWKRFAAPCAIQVAERLRKACPDVPIIYFANGGSPYFSEQVETLAGHIDVIGVDAHMRMEQAAEIIDRLGAGRGSSSPLILQGNVDPYVLRYGDEERIRQAVRQTIDAAGGAGRHILNLGHGVLQGTPEENVLYFVEEAQAYSGSH